MRQNLVKQSVFNRLLRHVDTIFPVFHRKRVATNADVLIQLLRVLRYGVPWRDTGGKASWQAIYKRFRLWTTHDVFRRLWKKTMKRYANEKFCEDPLWFRQVFLDCTLIKNYETTDCKGGNSTDRGRSGTKLSAVCDSNRVILGVVATPANTLDYHVASNTFDAIPFDLQPDHRRTIHVVTDKGYSYKPVANDLKRKDRRLLLVCEKHRNHKEEVNKKCKTREARSMLKQRHVIENAFALLKKFKRLRVRDDKKIENYLSFLLLGLIIRTDV